MINRWRLIEYTDDGCSEYECLKCKAGWEARTNPEWSKWQFCPYCGTKWDGQLENNRECSEKSWERKRARWNAPQRERSQRLIQPTWIFESFNPEWDTEWELHDHKPAPMSAKAARSWTKRLAEMHNEGWQWRARVVPTSETYPLP